MESNVQPKQTAEQILRELVKALAHARAIDVARWTAERRIADLGRALEDADRQKPDGGAR